MLKCKVQSYFCCLWFTSLLLQDLSRAAPAESQSAPCSISVSEPESNLDSISLTINTPGHDCSFTLTSPDTGADGAECKNRITTSGHEEVETNEIKEKEHTEEEVKEEKEGNYLGTNQLGVEDGGNKEAGGVFTCVLDHLEPGTAYLLQVQSQKDEETINITVHTRPSAVSGLSVTSRTGSSLGLSWQAGPGRTQRFRLQLQDHTGLLRNETLESTTTQHTVAHLSPGCLYNITMVTEAGGLQNSLTMETQTVPASVTNLTANSNRTSILLSWQQPEGDLDELDVSVSTNGTGLKEITLPPDATEVSVDQLTPGSAYHIIVITRAGKLKNQSELSVRTAPAAASQLSMSPSSNDGGLVLSWTPPAGHWESYRVSLFDGSLQLVSVALDQETVTFSFPGTGLIPGKLYRAELEVESGGLKAESSCEGAT
ncbi:receptor-type tyrosine-protein phosphatase beta-like, partial [Notolabrus celidotus]